MYYASTHVRTPKRKVSCTLVTTDGEIYDGNLFCTGDQRIKDLLNGENEFLPFETLGSTIYLINRACIARVMPRSERTESAGTESERASPLLS